MAKLNYIIASAAAAASLAFPLSGHAQTSVHQKTKAVYERPGNGFIKKAIKKSHDAYLKKDLIGTVTAVTGTSMTITAMKGSTYLIDASDAAFAKGFLKTSSTMTIADVNIGDQIAIKGTINGTSVKASMVRDFGQKVETDKRIVKGTVASIGGSTIILNAATGTAYTIDIGSAKLIQGMMGMSSLTIADIQTGDQLIVKGTTSGTAVTATAISNLSFLGRNLFMGSVTSVSGTVILVTDPKGTAYTVQTDGATLTKGMMGTSTPLTIGEIKVGDKLTIVGTLSGSTIAAAAIRDHGALKMHAGKQWMKGEYKR